MDRVFSLPELAESILLQLDMVTLLVSASRVNRAWNTFVNNSVPIQKALYFHPTSQNSAKDSSEQICHPVVNPLLKKTFGHCFFDTGLCDGYFLRANSFYSMPWTFDKRRPEPPIDFTETPPSNPKAPRRSNTTPLELHQIRLSGRKVLRKGASWRKMLVSQPAPPCLGYMFVNKYRRGHDGPLYVETSLINTGAESHPSSGLRMGMLYAFIQNWTGHPVHYSAWFRVTWDQPREPYVSPVCESKGREMLQQTNVVVEFGLLHMDQMQEPRDMDEFDRHFRSKDHQLLKVDHSEWTKDPDEYPGGSMDDGLMVL